jgi:thiamine biosynthesis lipoprotein
LRRVADHWVGSFTAMACPCELLIEDCNEEMARHLLEVVSSRAWRIEQKFSRYRDDNIVHAINTSEGRPVEVDEETAALIDFGAVLTRLSEGAFDLTSGVLRRAWTFDGGCRIPDPAKVTELMKQVGWHRVRWARPVLSLEPGMQIDFGGVGKEYAVDAAVRELRGLGVQPSCLVNLGGDLAITAPRQQGQPWVAGVEHCDQPGMALESLPILRGALATSGDSRRFLLHEGRRYSHILDARTGWPVVGAPRSITVLAQSCSEAGSLATLASLQGASAEEYLRAQGSRFWLQH